MNSHDIEKWKQQVKKATGLEILISQKLSDGSYLVDDGGKITNAFIAPSLERED
ncbi:MAG: hypothetical protein WD003_01700 [Candidatus Paceibacterota bacterium]